MTEIYEFCWFFFLVSKPKLRRIERKIVPVVQRLTKEDLIKSSMYQQFIAVMEKIFEQLDETEGPINLDDEEDEQYDCISTHLLAKISGEAAKLKSKNAIDTVPENQLTLLINYAMRSLHTAKNLSAGPVSFE